MLAIDYCVETKKKTKEKNRKNLQFLSTEKMKQNPDLKKINKSQNHLQDIQNYKATGSMIRSREKLII